MGRKKIEIRPLADERNRNVTFLKRKAGLMKKAWELSVLCTADVSILIFSPSGKPYEFSSKELDGEIDRYLDYEGLIERRRAPEFAAMAADDDEDEQLSRRGSSSRIINLANGAPAKSMKGKESFKSRMTSRAHLARSVNGRKGKGRESEKRAGFIDGILDASSRDGESSGSESEGEGEMPEKKSVVLPGTAHGHGSGVGESSRAQRTVSTSSGLAGLHYAMNFQTHPEPSQSPRSLQPTLNGMYPSYSNHGNIPQLPHLPHPNTHPQPFRTDIPQLPYQPNFSFPPVNYHNVFAPTPPSQPVLPNNMIQWDPNLLSRYAEYRLQQNHQRQQRALLDRQRQQLAELGILSDEKTLMEQLFRAGGTNDTQFAESEQPFEWPDVGQARQAQSRRHDDHGSMFDQKEGIVWPTNEGCPLSSPASVDIPRQEKRERERDRGEGREGKRNRVS